MGRVLDFLGQQPFVPFLHLGESQAIVEWGDGKISTVNNRNVLGERIESLTVVEVTTMYLNKALLVCRSKQYQRISR